MPIKKTAAAPSSTPSPTQANVAPIVRRWRRILAEADDPQATTSKLVYEMLVQIRAIKLILAWVLIFIPAGAAVVLIVLTSLAKSSAPEYDPYSY